MINNTPMLFILLFNKVYLNSDIKMKRKEEKKRKEKEKSETKGRKIKKRKRSINKTHTNDIAHHQSIQPANAACLPSTKW